VPETTNNLPRPPTGVWRALLLILLILAKIGGQGRGAGAVGAQALGVWGAGAPAPLAAPDAELGPGSTTKTA
jgi:hypothetical protein